MLLLSDKLVSCVAGTNGCLGLRRSNEALALSQGWLEALLPSYRWICWENASSGHNKHQEGIQRILREPAICSYAMYPTLSQELCVMLGQRVRDPLSLSTISLLCVPLKIRETHLPCLCRTNNRLTAPTGTKAGGFSTREVDPRPGHAADTQHWG